MIPIIGEGQKRDPRALELATKKGTFIPNIRQAEWLPHMLQHAVEQVKRDRPGAELRSSTATYNCVGLVFASRRTWVESDHLPMILEEDGFQKLQQEKDVRVGDLAVYEDGGSPSHVGIVVKIEQDIAHAEFRFTVLSKWGQVGEYIHDLEDVPFTCGEPKSFWTERKGTT